MSINKHENMSIKKGVLVFGHDIINFCKAVTGLQNLIFISENRHYFLLIFEVPSARLGFVGSLL